MKKTGHGIGNFFFNSVEKVSSIKQFIENVLDPGTHKIGKKEITKGINPFYIISNILEGQKVIHTCSNKTYDGISSRLYRTLERSKGQPF